MALEDFYAFFTKADHIGAGATIATLNAVTQVVKNFGNATHADAANPYKVKGANVERHFPHASRCSDHTRAGLVHAMLNSDLARPTTDLAAPSIALDFAISALCANCSGFSSTARKISLNPLAAISVWGTIQAAPACCK